MSPRMGKFAQALSVWQTREESDDSTMIGPGRHTVAVYSTPTLLAVAFLSLFTQVPLNSIRQGVTFCVYMRPDF
jgi:hypothetical protein